MNVLGDLRARAAVEPAHIVLSEGEDPRIVAGALAALDEGLGPITLLGSAERIDKLLEAEGAQAREGLSVVDPANAEQSARYAELYLELRRHKGVSDAAAATQVRNPMVFAALMVRNGDADGTVGGAVATTSDTVRAALTMIGKAPDADLVSSFFLMALPEAHPSGRAAMIFADCGLVIAPTATELASIAAQSAASCRQILGDEPGVAMLSFSTRGSAHHASIDKVTEALALLRAAHPDLRADGELQFDAAFVPSVAASKAPGSDVAGHANVFIFPDLGAGNIGYKIAQRVGGCEAIGPVLQGLARPANDLSRGCTAQDVTNMIAVTTLQARK